MLTALLIATSILLALSGIALIKLSKAYRHQVASYDVLQSIFKSHYDELITERDAAIEELQTTKHNAYHREQELLNALEDATRAADDNEWLHQDSEKCYAEAVAELAELQEVHKAYVEGTSEFTANQAREIADLQDTIFAYQTEIHHKAIRIAELKRNLKAVKEELQDELNNTRYKLNQKNSHIADLKKSLNNVIDYWETAAQKNREAREELAAVKEELAETKTLADNLMSDRIEAIAHMKEQNEKIAELELKEFYDSCEDLDEAIEAAAPQEDIIHLDGNKVWSAIGNWTRLIVYKSSPYHCYIQKAIDGPTKRLAAADLTEAQRTTFKALKTAVKYI